MCSGVDCMSSARRSSLTRSLLRVFNRQVNVDPGLVDSLPELLTGLCGGSLHRRLRPCGAVGDVRQVAWDSPSFVPVILQSLDEVLFPVLGQIGIQHGRVVPLDGFSHLARGGAADQGEHRRPSRL
jgi:hypothetical protein